MNTSDTELQYSAFRIISMALDGFYEAYLQLHLPACVHSTLRDQTKKMVIELYTVAPTEARGVIVDLIKKHGQGKGDAYPAKVLEEAEVWIASVDESRRMVNAQLTESREPHGYNTEFDNLLQGI